MSNISFLKLSEQEALLPDFMRKKGFGKKNGATSPNPVPFRRTRPS